MKKLVDYSVELTNLDTFKPYPGAEAFATRYRAHRHDDFYFRFDLERDDCQKAEADLKKARLAYRRYYGLALQPDEMAAHPVFYLVIPSLYDAVTNSKRVVLSNEVANHPLAQDFHDERVVMQVELFRLLTALAPRIEPVGGVLTVKRKKYRLLGKLPELELPIRITAKRVKASVGADYAGTHYPDGTDGTTTLSETAVALVAKHHLMQSRRFTIDGKKVYREAAAHYLISGPLAHAIHERYGDQIQLSPMTFDLVGKPTRREQKTRVRSWNADRAVSRSRRRRHPAPTSRS